MYVVEVTFTQQLDAHWSVLHQQSICCHSVSHYQNMEQNSTASPRMSMLHIYCVQRLKLLLKVEVLGTINRKKKQDSRSSTKALPAKHTKLYLLT